MIFSNEDKTREKRFMTCLEEHSISPLVRELEVSTHTASAAADALGCKISQIVKSLVFVTLTTRRPVLVLVSGANKADPLRLSEILGEKVRLANEQAVFEITNYPVGAVPPAGFEPPLFTLIDEVLAHHEILWTSGGSNHTQVAISYRDLCLITGGKVTTISHPLAIPVTVVPYDPEWPNRFKKEKNEIMNSIGIYLEAIEHIGSTAVPGLAAKPIIDIMAGAKTLTEAPLFIPPLVARGYQYVPEFESQMPERRYLRKIACKQITTHLHIVESASQFWKEHIAFRDLLIANPAIRESYATLKRELAARYGNDRVGYTDAKSDFILKTLNMSDS